MPRPNSELEEAIRFAAQSLEHEIRKSQTPNSMDHKVMRRLGRAALEPDEKVIFTLKQSRLHALLDPGIVLATNRKIVMANPSLWHYLGIQSLTLKSYEGFNYGRITGVSVRHGLYLKTVMLSTVEAQGRIQVDGLRLVDAELLVKFVQRILERIV